MRVPRAKLVCPDLCGPLRKQIAAYFSAVDWKCATIGDKYRKVYHFLAQLSLCDFNNYISNKHRFWHQDSSTFGSVNSLCIYVGKSQSCRRCQLFSPSFFHSFLVFIPRQLKLKVISICRHTLRCASDFHDVTITTTSLTQKFIHPRFSLQR